MQELKDTSLYADGNLVGYWRLEGNSTDETANNLDGTDTAITYGTAYGKFGQGALFNGSSSMIEIPTVTMGNSFTYSCWINPTTISDYKSFCGYRIDTGNFNWRYLGFQTSSKVGFNVRTSQGIVDNCTSTSSITINNWFHIVGTYDGSNAKIYINGVLENTKAITLTNYENTIQKIGVVTGVDYFNGSIDDLAVFSRALTSTEIQNLYDRGIKKINGVYMGSQEIASTRFAGDANLIEYLRFEGNSTATVGSNGSDANMTYGTGYGKFGQGALFNGSNSQIQIAGDLGIAGGAITVSTWFKVTTSSTIRCIFSQIDAGTHVGYFMYVTPNANQVSFYRVRMAVAQDGAVVTQNITVGTWYHYVLTYDGTNVRGYINGNLLGSPVASSGNGGGSQTDIVSIGSESGTSAFFDGSIDDFSVFTRALTSDEIYSLYKTGVKKLNGVVNLNPELESSSLRGDANLVQYTRFEGNSTATVGNNGTDTAITYGTTYGKHGQGASFNGTSSKIVLADTNFPLGNGDRTICAWIKLDAIGAERTILDYGTRANYQDVAFDVLSTGKLWMDIYNEGKGGDKVLAAGVWNHVAVSYIGSTKTASFYINGVLDRAQTYTNALNTTLSTARIGCLQTDAHYFFNGSIDEVSVFSRALTATEISNLYNTNIKKYMGVSNT